MKGEIINKASELFLNLGFKSVTMDDIAGELGISKKTIYTHFNNKEAIVDAVTDTIFETVCKDVDAICAQQQNPIEELYDIKKKVMQHMRNEKASPWFQLQKYYPKIFQSIKKRQFLYMQNCVTNNLKRGINQGVFRQNINIDFVSRIYFVGVTGIKDGDLFPALLFNSNDLYEQYLEYHLRGIVTTKGLKILNNIIHSTIN